MDNKGLFGTLKSFWWLPLALYCFFVFGKAIGKNNDILLRQKKLFLKNEKTVIHRELSSIFLDKPYAGEPKFKDGQIFCSLDRENSLLLFFKKGKYMMAGGMNELGEDIYRDTKRFIIESGEYSIAEEGIILSSLQKNATMKNLTVTSASDLSKLAKRISYYSGILSREICSELEVKLATNLFKSYMN